ncbi:MAG: DUF3137 domain-containing protein [Eubacteriales bacterium]|nr:DUF3137 domain-containing protein [Clostridiales bacterium]MDD7302385.1 DUF3137 domain-containing protein [Eubacteriales bacterium]
MFRKMFALDSDSPLLKLSRVVIAFVALLPAMNALLFFDNSPSFIGAVLAIIVYALVFGALSLLTTAILGIVRARVQFRALAEADADGTGELERKRIKAQTIGNIIKLLEGLTSIACAVAFISGAAMIGVAAVIALAVIALIYKVTIKPMVDDYKLSFKDAVVKPALEEFLSDLDYRPTESIPYPDILASRLFPAHTECSGNDLIKAKYRDLSFTQSNVTMLDEREVMGDPENGGVTTTEKVVVFSGTLMMMDFDAFSDEPVAVRRRSGKPGKNDILTESDAFNKLFRIDAKDAVSALRILTPPVLEGFINASEKLKCPLEAAFRNDKLYITLANGDTLEANETGTRTINEQRERIKTEMQDILSVVDNIYISAIIKNRAKPSGADGAGKSDQ